MNFLNESKKRISELEILELGYHECDGGGCCGPRGEVDYLKLEKFVKSELALLIQTACEALEKEKKSPWSDNDERLFNLGLKRAQSILKGLIE